MDWAPEGGEKPGYYKNLLERNYVNWGEYSVTGASVSTLEVSGVLLLLDMRGPFVDNNRALANKIAFECHPVVVMCPGSFLGTPWVPVDVNEPKKDDNDNEDYVEKDAEGKRPTRSGDLSTASTGST